MKTIKLLKVDHLPMELQDGYLYVSEAFGVAGHLCPCGCKSKVITPLEPSEWSLEEHNGRPSLTPSIGNWQLPCRSHYWVTKGAIVWSYQWSDAQIEEGRLLEEEKRKTYYNNSENKPKKLSLYQRLINFIFGQGK